MEAQKVNTLVTTNLDIINLAAIIEAVSNHVDGDFKTGNIKSFIEALKNVTKEDCFNTNFQSFLKKELDLAALKALEKLFIAKNKYREALIEHFLRKEKIPKNSPFYEVLIEKNKEKNYVEKDFIQEQLVKLYREINEELIYENRVIADTSIILEGTWIAFNSLRYLEDKGKETVSVDGENKKRDASDVVLRAIWTFKTYQEGNDTYYQIIRRSNTHIHTGKLKKDDPLIFALRKEEDNKQSLFLGKLDTKNENQILKLTRVREHKRKPVLFREFLVKIETTEENIQEILKIPDTVLLHDNFLKVLQDKKYISDDIKLDGIRRFIMRPTYPLGDLEYVKAYMGLRGIWKVYTWLNNDELSIAPMLIHSPHYVKFKTRGEVNYTNGVIQRVSDTKFCMVFTVEGRHSYYIIDHRQIGESAFADVNLLKGSYLLSGVDKVLNGICLFVKEDLTETQILKQKQNIDIQLELFHDFDSPKYLYDSIPYNELKDNELYRRVLAYLPKPAFKLEQLDTTIRDEEWNNMGKKYKNPDAQGEWYEGEWKLVSINPIESVWQLQISDVHIFNKLNGYFDGEITGQSRIEVKKKDDYVRMTIVGVRKIAILICQNPDEGETDIDWIQCAYIKVNDKKGTARVPMVGIAILVKPDKLRYERDTYPETDIRYKEILNTILESADNLPNDIDNKYTEMLNAQVDSINTLSSQSDFKEQEKNNNNGIVTIGHILKMQPVSRKYKDAYYYTPIEIKNYLKQKISNDLLFLWESIFGVGIDTLLNAKDKNTLRMPVKSDKVFEDFYKGLIKQLPNNAIIKATCLLTESFLNDKKTLDIIENFVSQDAQGIQGKIIRYFFVYQNDNFNGLSSDETIIAANHYDMIQKHYNLYGKENENKGEIYVVLFSKLATQSHIPYDDESNQIVEELDYLMATIDYPKEDKPNTITNERLYPTPISWEIDVTRTRFIREFRIHASPEIHKLFINRFHKLKEVENKWRERGIIQRVNEDWFKKYKREENK